MNSYKRLVRQGSMSGFTWAPVFVCYGNNNRTNMLRIPMNGGRDRMPRGGHLLQSLSGAAMMLTAGLEGIREKLDPGDAAPREHVSAYSESDCTSMGIEHLPRTLGEAVDAFEADPLSAQVMGPLMSKTFVEFKRAEWVEYHTHVSDWEIKPLPEILLINRGLPPLPSLWLECRAAGSAEPKMQAVTAGPGGPANPPPAPCERSR